MKEIRYTHEDALNESEEIKSIAGQNAEAEDYKIANQLIEDEKGKDQGRWLEHLNKGYITIFLAAKDKNIMIGINSTEVVNKIYERMLEIELESKEQELLK